MSNPARGLVAEAGEKIEIDPGQIGKVAISSLAIRFAFGAAVAVAAGIIGIYFGPKVGGLFLAFPAILPASLTLIARKDGRQEAEIDSLGATMGAVAMIGFALIAAGGIITIGAVPALALALAAWLTVSLGLYFTVSRLLHRRRATAAKVRRPDDATR